MAKSNVKFHESSIDKHYNKANDAAAKSKALAHKKGKKNTGSFSDDPGVRAMNRGVGFGDSRK